MNHHSNVKEPKHGRALLEKMQAVDDKDDPLVLLKSLGGGDADRGKALLRDIDQWTKEFKNKQK